MLHASVPDVLPLPVTDISQQSKQITGMVFDELINILIGVNIVEKATLNETMTCLNGKFAADVANHTTFDNLS